MREITFREAIREALREEMLRDDKVFLLGEDIGFFGGYLGVTKGLWEEFGADRIIETPISELVITGSSVGAALNGMRPVAEIMFADFLTFAMDALVNSAAKMRYAYGGEVTVPLVVRAAFGGGEGGDGQHVQNLEAWFAHVPGLKVVMPSTPYDAKGLLKSSIRDDNPVIFFEHRCLYASKGCVPEDDYIIPLGKADIKREGKDLSIIATAAMVHKSLAVAERLAEEGISIEVIDPRTLRPLDKETIINSVIKTGRVLIVHEAWLTGGFGAEIAAILADEAFNSLKAPIKRVASLETPYPLSPILQKEYLPDEKKIMKAIKQILGISRKQKVSYN